MKEQRDNKVKDCHQGIDSDIMGRKRRKKLVKGKQNQRIKGQARADNIVRGQAAEIHPDWETRSDGATRTCAKKGEEEDRWSYQDWRQEVKPQAKFSHKLVPIV